MIENSFNVNRYILPKVSVCMCTYNRSSVISEAIDSILASTFKNFELIIVDDGSTDNTEEIVMKYVENDSRVRYYKKRHCFYESRSDAFRLATGKYIMVADSDDLIHNQKIEILVNALDKRKDIDIIYPYFSTVDITYENYKNSMNCFSEEDISYAIENAVKDDPIFGFMMFRRKKCLSKFLSGNYFVPNMMAREDNMFCTTLINCFGMESYMINLNLQIYRYDYTKDPTTKIYSYMSINAITSDKKVNIINNLKLYNKCNAD